jgi:hypothetical protein
MVGRLISILVVSMMVLAAVALIAVGPGPFARVLPPAATVWVEGLVGPSGLVGGGAAARRGDTAADFLDDTAEGLVAAGPIAAMAGNAPVFIAEVLSGHSTEVAAAIPAELTTIRPILGCLLTPPQGGTLVGHATAGQSDLPMAMVTYDDGDLAVAVQEFVDTYRKRGVAMPVDSAALAYQAYDVAVTETEAPVYLVLENRGGNRIWNIHLAPGARVERVVLLGGAQAGVANLDPVVPVEVILEDGLAACGIAPAHALNPGNAIFTAVAEGRLTQFEANARITEAADAAEAYDIWFRDSFGVTAADSRAGFDVGMVSLVGPVPVGDAPKAVYARLDGARIRLTQDTYFEIIGQVSAGQDFAARVTEIATGFAFGDLANLRQGVGF